MQLLVVWDNITLRVLDISPSALFEDSVISVGDASTSAVATVARDFLCALIVGINYQFTVEGKNPTNNILLIGTRDYIAWVEVYIQNRESSQHLKNSQVFLRGVQVFWC